MEKNFEIKPFVIEGNSGYISASVKVKGYWSHDPITATLRRNWNQNKQENAWDLRVSHSSGGRDLNEVACDAEASTNFAHALIALSAYAKDFLENHVDELEVEYQITREAARVAEQEMRARLAAEQAERLREDPKIDSDVAMRLLRTLDEDSYICMFERGSTNRWWRITMVKHPTMTLYQKNYKRIGKRELIELMLTSSHRTTMVYRDNRGTMQAGEPLALELQ